MTHHNLRICPVCEKKSRRLTRHITFHHPDADTQRQFGIRLSGDILQGTERITYRTDSKPLTVSEEDVRESRGPELIEVRSRKSNVKEAWGHGYERGSRA